MTVSMETVVPVSIIYPESDGKPMAENDVQYRWIVMIKENLNALLPDYVASDLFWYPVEGSPYIVQAPDTMVAFGRPKRDRGSYRQWEENNVAPAVVFEILSPSNTYVEMQKKRRFYERYGVEEYYVYNPDNHLLEIWLRQGDVLALHPYQNGWVSPRLGIRFDLSQDEMVLFKPNGERFLTFQELLSERDRERQEKEQALQVAETERQRAETERQRAETERQRAEALAERLRKLGVDPE